MANNGGVSLRTSGTKGALQKSGGLTNAVTSSGNRSTSELNLIQSFADRTSTATIKANNMLQSGYSALAGMSGGVLGTAQDISTMLGTLAGARGGGGQVILDSILGAGGDKKGGLSALLKGGAAVAGMVGMENVSGSPSNPASIYQDLPGYMKAKASNAGPMYTGAITVNVTAPPSSDPYSYGLAIGNAMTARS